MKLKSLFAFLVLSIATIANANVMKEMFQMNRQMGTLINADSTEEFKQAVVQFIQSAEQARNKMPASLDDDQERFKAYQQAMQELIDIAKQANEFANQGELDEAKALAKKLNMLKKEGHTEFK